MCTTISRYAYVFYILSISFWRPPYVQCMQHELYSRDMIYICIYMYYNIYIYICIKDAITLVVPAVVIHLNYILPIVQCAESAKFYQQDSQVKLRFLCGEGIRGSRTKSAVHTGPGHRTYTDFCSSTCFLFIYRMWWYWDVSDLHSKQHVNSQRSMVQKLQVVLQRLPVPATSLPCGTTRGPYQHLYFANGEHNAGKMFPFWSNHQLR